MENVQKNGTGCNKCRPNANKITLVYNSQSIRFLEIKNKYRTYSGTRLLFVCNL